MVCRYSADGFYLLLSQFNLLSKHPTLVDHLRHGFPMARNPLIPLPTSTFLPPNHSSSSDTPEHRQFVADYLQEEERAGRMSAAYPEDIVREYFVHLRSSPLGVVDKTTPAGQPQKFRLITDGSHSDRFGTSINDLIDSDEFPTRWHDASCMATLVSLFSLVTYCSRSIGR